MITPLLKPGQIKRKSAAVLERGDREICNQSLRTGKLEYRRRVAEMVYRQDRRCALQISHWCQKGNGYLSIYSATFDHEAGRGLNGSHRDDRIEVDGQWQNAAVCEACNILKGSKRYHWRNSLYVPVGATDE
jgi:hypothetical protein